MVMILKNNELFNKYDSMPAYCMGLLKSHGLWKLAIRMIRYTRRYFLISKLIRYTSYIIAAIETSALLILVFSALLILAPIGLIVFGSTLILNRFGYKKLKDEILNDIYNKKTVIIDAPKGYFRNKQAYLNNMARCFCNEGYSVLVISRSFTADRFFTAKKAANKIWVIKLSCFFMLKNKLNTEKTTYIY